MCGIAGYFSPSGRFQADCLRPMAEAIRHRGPDASGEWHDAHCGLAHRRLSILDLSSDGKQPMTSHCGRYQIAFNGEVYNFKEIARDLGIQPRTQTDTEVILESLVKEGLAAANRFNGMFAIALYDTQTHTLELIRDRIGVKPVVYYWDGSNFAFASELKALCTLPVQKSIDMQSLQDYFFLEYVPGNQTIWQEFKKLPAGHAITLTNNNLSIRQWYNLREKALLEKSNDKSLIDSTLDAFISSVSLRKISDVPIGAFLSGGTDSSLIAAGYQQVSDAPIRTFTIGFDVAQYNESHYAEAVAKHLGTTHLTVPLRLAEARDRVAHIFEHYDEPFAVSSTLPTLLLSEVTRRHVTVAMSGDGGDELYMGYGYYRWWQRWQKLQRMGGSLGRQAMSWLLSKGDARKRRAARVLNGPADDSWWLHIWGQEQYMFSQREVSLLTQDNYQHATLLDDWRAIDGMSLHPWEKISLFDIENYLANNLLYKVDIASMAHGLEVRVPFLDYRLVELALRTPLAHKMNATEQKILPKQLLTKYLPQELVHRKKWGFPAPIGEWLNNELRYLVDELLDPQYLHQQGIFNPLFVQRLVKEYQSGKFPYHHKRIMSLVFFQLWYRQYA